MTFILGTVLFLLGAFLGMLTMAFAQTLPRQVQEQQEALVAQLRLVATDE
jgi:hypothetical protein